MPKPLRFPQRLVCAPEMDDNLAFKVRYMSVSYSIVKSVIALTVICVFAVLSKIMLIKKLTLYPAYFRVKRNSL